MCLLCSLRAVTTAAPMILRRFLLLLPLAGVRQSSVSHATLFMEIATSHATTKVVKIIPYTSRYELIAAQKELTLSGDK